MASEPDQLRLKAASPPSRGGMGDVYKRGLNSFLVRLNSQGAHKDD